MYCNWAGTVVLALALAGCNEQQTAQTPPSSIRPEVSVVTLHARSVAITAELPGRISASLVSDVRPQVSGIVKSRLFKEGSEVKAGDVLYEIDPASYQASFDSANAALQKAQAAVPTAQAKAGRYQALIQKNAVSQQDLDDVQSSLMQAKADVASAQAALEMARINLNFTKVTAPIAGRVDASTVTEGALVTAQQTTALTTIRALDPINVDVTESSANLLKFRDAVSTGKLKTTGPNVAVKLILETGNTYDQNGTFQFITSSIDPTTGTFSLRAAFPNPVRLLLPGMYVRAELQEGVAPNSILVPQRAVTYNAKGEATAKFIDKDGKVVEHVLSVRQNIGNNWLVDNGAVEGDRVIVEGSQLVRAGSQANAVEVSVDDATGDIRRLTENLPDSATPAPATQNSKG